MRKAAIHTLGCKVNQCDSEKVMAALARCGYEEIDFNTQTEAQSADLYIVNTCAVTQTGAAKSLQTLRRAKSKNPRAIIAACGCLVKTNPEDVAKTGADIIFDARRPEDLIAFLHALPADSAAVPPKKRTRAYIKIQDGCDRFCSYCVVPYARGALASRPPGEILAEARQLIQNGAREIVLTGIQAAAYGKDMEAGGAVSFPQLIRQAASLPGLARLRLGSIEPYAVNGVFLEAVAAPNVCPHFHLSLQSGCDKTLAAMNRRYTADDYRNTAQSIRKAKPGAALTTDIMVGFPGETDADFQASLAFAEEMAFARAHIFVYSPRKGTPAAEMAGQVPGAVKAQRGKQMREMAAKLEQRYLRAHIGTLTPVLFETKQRGYWEGHTADYMTVRAQSGKNLANEIINVIPHEESKGILYGGIV